LRPTLADRVRLAQQIGIVIDTVTGIWREGIALYRQCRQASHDPDEGQGGYEDIVTVSGYIATLIHHSNPSSISLGVAIDAAQGAATILSNRRLHIANFRSQRHHHFFHHFQITVATNEARDIRKSVNR